MDTKGQAFARARAVALIFVALELVAVAAGERDAGLWQRALWPLQGQGRVWFCGAYFGYSFHEDGLQSGLEVAEAIGGVKRPWRVENESGRLAL